MLEWVHSYCSLKPLCSGMGEVVPARTSPTLLPHPLALCCHYPVWKCRSASIAVTGTVRVKHAPVHQFCDEHLELTSASCTAPMYFLHFTVPKHCTNKSWPGNPHSLPNILPFICFHSCPIYLFSCDLIKTYCYFSGCWRHCLWLWCSWNFFLANFTWYIALNDDILHKFYTSELNIIILNAFNTFMSIRYLFPVFICMGVIVYIYLNSRSRKDWITRLTDYCVCFGD